MPQSNTGRSFSPEQRRQPADFPIANLLSAQEVEEAVTAEGYIYRDRLFAPFITIWVLCGQVLDSDHSCRQAVLRLAAWLKANGQAVCSTCTGAYCKARQRLPEGIMARLARSVGQKVERQSPASWLWHRLRVLLADGSTLTMADSKANQKKYPQSRSQKKGLGFPIMRICIIFSLSTGVVLDAAFNPYRGKGTGETAMLRSMMASLGAGDLLLGDRYYANYWIIAIAQLLHVEVVFRQHQLRKVDFRKGQRLGKDDHIITWEKPQRPKWMFVVLYGLLPDTLTLRETRLRIAKNKRRTKVIVVVTTLLDARRYPKADLHELYRQRWQAELNLRSLKAQMQMGILRCKSPDMVHKEIWAHFLVYNLVRKAMAQAAEKHKLRTWQISFKGALQALNAFGGFWPMSRLPDPDGYYDLFLDVIAQHRVGNRPDRTEPRRVKRRAKPYPLLNKPRDQARAEELAA